MLWENDDNQKHDLTASDVVDLAFQVTCKTLPLDHLHELSEAVGEVLPWLADEAMAGLHLIHGAESGNGWIRPEDVSSELLHLSRRTRMTLRVPSTRIDDARMLTGKTLDIGGHPLSVGDAAVKPLSTYGTLFSRYIICDCDTDEEVFLDATIEQIREMGIHLQKVLCGKAHVFSTPDGPLHTRSVMVAGLKPAEALKLQELGIGPGRHLGCGLFIPHKGIEAVKKLTDD